MSSESITTAIFLITVLVCAGIFLNAFIPAILSSSSAQIEAGVQESEYLITDLKIILSYSNTAGSNAEIWIKNSGASKLSNTTIKGADIFIGRPDDFERLTYEDGALSSGEWNYEIISEDKRLGNAASLKSKDTLHITAKSAKIPLSADTAVYFSMALSNGYTLTDTFYPSAIS